MNPVVKQKVEDFFTGYPIMEYEKGETIVFAGEPPQAVLYMLEGMVEQYDITPEGNRVVVNMFKPPAFFPMSWALNDTQNPYFMASVAKVRAHAAPREDVVKFLQKNGDVTLDLLSRVYKGTDGLLRRLVLASSGVASARLVFELIIEAYRFGETQPDGKILIGRRQANLAARTGLARETVSRELSKLQAGKYIVVRAEGIEVTIDDLEAYLSTLG